MSNTQSTDKARVGSLEELKSGKPMITKVNKQLVAVFMCQGNVVATNGRCPHASGPIHEGEVEGTRLTCPWHGWTFDLVSGECEEDPDLVLERYPVELDGDDILVTL